MEEMDPRHRELYELLKPTLGEEPARRLIFALPTSVDRLATRDDVEVLGSRLGPEIDTLKSDVETLKSDVGTLKSDVAELREQFTVFQAQFGERIAQMEATLTRRMVTIMGAWTVAVGSTFAWASLLIQ